MPAPSLLPTFLPTLIPTLGLGLALSTPPVVLPDPVRCDGSFVAGLLSNATSHPLPGLTDPGGHGWAAMRAVDAQVASRVGDIDAVRQVDRQLRGR